MTCPRRSQRLAAGAAIAVLLLGAGACTANDGGDAAPAKTTVAASSAAADASGSMAPTDGQPFGPECPNLPDSGSGSLVDLSNREWVEAIAQLPALGQLSVTIALAGLGQDFDGLPEATVFAPTDTAFRALGIARARELLTDPAKAADVLRYHVVAGRVAPDALAGEHRTLSGQTLEITGSGEDFTANGQAKIICGNLRTRNATIYLVDQVLQPS